MEPNNKKKVLELGQELRSCRSRMAEKQIQEEQLAQVRKMDSLASLAAGMAHDFNNILQSILGHAQLALLSENNPNQDTFREIERIVHKGRELTEQFLVFGRKRLPLLSSLDLNQRILEFRNRLKRSIPGTIDIDVDLSDDLKPIQADALQIEKVLMNLVANAKDAMPQGGRLIFRTRSIHIAEGHPIIACGASEGEYVHLSVSDTGCGIAPENLHKVYEPFFTTKTNSRGRGLGLAIVYAIVKNHGGFINCSSKSECGADFSLYFPASSAEQKDMQRAPRRAGERAEWKEEDEASLMA